MYRRHSRYIDITLGAIGNPDNQQEEPSHKLFQFIIFVVSVIEITLIFKFLCLTI